MCDRGLVENYGDTHLHYDGYPDYNGFYSGHCKWDGSSYTPGSLHVPDEPLYPQRCPTEYCHPGTWQGTDGGSCGAAAIPTHVLPPTGLNELQEGFGGIEGLGGAEWNGIPGILIVIAIFWFLSQSGILKF